MESIYAVYIISELVHGYNIQENRKAVFPRDLELYAYFDDLGNAQDFVINNETGMDELVNNYVGIFEYEAEGLARVVNQEYYKYNAKERMYEIINDHIDFVKPGYTPYDDSLFAEDDDVITMISDKKETYLSKEWGFDLFVLKQFLYELSKINRLNSKFFYKVEQGASRLVGFNVTMEDYFNLALKYTSYLSTVFKVDVETTDQFRALTKEFKTMYENYLTVPKFKGIFDLRPFIENDLFKVFYLTDFKFGKNTRKNKL